MTPVRSPATEAERKYNEAHCRTRVRVEQAFGVLKMRFRCLQRYRTLHFAPDRAANIVTACAILHNICQKYNISGDNYESEMEERSGGEEEENPPEDEVGDPSSGIATRNNIIAAYYA